MATATRNEDLEWYYLDHVVNHFDQDRGMDIHASDIDGGCMLKSFYRRTIKPKPKLDRDTVIKFIRGWSAEGVLAPKLQESVEKEGIICSIDDKVFDRCVEIKSTIKSLKRFDPLKTYPWWITRCKTYCYAHEVTSMDLFVVFWIGWPPGTPGDVRAWVLDFTKEEIDENWARMQERRSVLLHALRTGLPVSYEWVTPHKFAKGTECTGCEFADHHCYWYETYHDYYRRRPDVHRKS